MTGPTITQADVTIGALPQVHDLNSILRAPARELDDYARERWEKLQAIGAQMAEFRNIARDLKKELREHLGLGEFAIGGDPVFRIIENRRWSEEVARTMLPIAVIHDLEITIIDRKQAEERLPAAWYHLCQAVVGEPAVHPIPKRGRS